MLERSPIALVFVSSVPQFHLCDTESALHTAAEWAGRKAVLLYFVTVDCPVTNSRSEEHTSELQSLRHLVCRLLLEKKRALDGIREAGAAARERGRAADLSGGARRAWRAWWCLNTRTRLASASGFVFFFFFNAGPPPKTPPPPPPRPWPR